MKKIVTIIICLVIPLWGLSKTYPTTDEIFYLGEIENDLSVTGQEIFNTITQKLDSLGFIPAKTKLKCEIDGDKSGYTVEVVATWHSRIYPPYDLKNYTYGYKYINGYFVKFEILTSTANGSYFPLKLPLKVSQKNKKKFTFGSGDLFFNDSYIVWKYFISSDGKIKLEAIRFVPPDDSYLIDFNETFPFF